MEKRPGIYKEATAAAEASGARIAKASDDLTLYEYPDYETYRKVQEDGNKAKLKKQFVRESHVARLSAFLRSRLDGITFGLCHGTRAGREQAWFAKHLGQGTVIGTEISETATQFANTVQWDFHDTNPDWVGRADFVYSNSWDHAFEPELAFRVWFDQLRAGGFLLLDHTKGQMPRAANALDPFGASLPALEALLTAAAGDQLAGLSVIDHHDNPEYRASVVVVQKAGKDAAPR